MSTPLTLMDVIVSPDSATMTIAGGGSARYLVMALPMAVAAAPTRPTSQTSPARRVAVSPEIRHSFSNFLIRLTPSPQRLGARVGETLEQGVDGRQLNGTALLVARAGKERQ